MDLKYVLKYIYVLDVKQLKSICKNLNVDYNIYLETDNGIKKIGDSLHKEFIINKIIKTLNGEKDKKIIYSKSIQNYESTNNLTENDVVYYGQYKTTDKNIKQLLLKLTNGQFKFGAISQKIIKNCWLNNKKISYIKFAKLWLTEHVNGEINYEELAYNKFMKINGDKEKWFELKEKITDDFKKMEIL